MNAKTIKEKLKNLSGLKLLITSFFIGYFDSIKEIFIIHYNPFLLGYLFTIALGILMFIILRTRHPFEQQTYIQKKKKKKKKKKK